MLLLPRPQGDTMTYTYVDPFPHSREGYRYIRSYETKSGRRWALWERSDGRMQRVGTAYSEEEYRAFLQGKERKP